MAYIFEPLKDELFYISNRINYLYQFYSLTTGASELNSPPTSFEISHIKQTICRHFFSLFGYCYIAIIVQKYNSIGIATGNVLKVTINLFNLFNLKQTLLTKSFLTKSFFIPILTIIGLFSSYSHSHGVVSSSATITARSNNLVEIKVQFNLQALLNNVNKKYDLVQLTALSDQKFDILYNQIIEVFDKGLNVKIGNKPIKLNKRYPSKEQIKALINREFIESKMSDTARRNIPYTYDERRHYQVFYFGFKIENSKVLDKLNIDFPAALGNVYVTYSRSSTSVLHPQESWVPKQY